ncbi:hypothetical protein [Haloferula sargassicola]
MSRRARRRAGKAAGNPSWLRVILTLGAVALVGMLGAWVGLRQWLHSDDFRHMLEAETGKGMKAEATFGAFQWDGTLVRTPSFTAEGKETLRRVEADNLSLDIGLGKVREGVVQLRDGRIGRLLVEVDPGAGEPAPAQPPEGGVPREKPAKWYDAFTPDEVELTGLEIGESALTVDLKEGPFSVAGARWSIRPGQAKGAYEAIGTGGVVRFPWDKLPPLRMEQTRLRYQQDRVYLSEALFRLYDRAQLRLTGEAALDGGGYAFDGILQDVDLAQVLPEDWKRKLEGELDATFSVRTEGEDPVVKGHVDVQRGVLTGLPVLDALGAYGGNPRFRRLALSEASADFLRKDGSLWLSNLVLASEGLMRVEGEVGIGPSKELDGRIRLGLTPGTLAMIPGAETKVFLPGERGLLWTTVRLSGTTEDPDEDLTARLIAAAGLRMFEVLPETGEQVLKFTRRAVSPETLRELAEHPEMIRQGSDLIEQTRKALDGDGDPIEEATKILRDGKDLLDVGKSLFESIHGGGQ